VVLASIGVIHSQVHWGGVLLSVFFLTNYSAYIIGVGLPAGLTVLWSLSVEEHFYLLFPFAYKGVLKAGWSEKRQAALFGVVCGVVLLWRVVNMAVMQSDWLRVYIGTDTRLDSILFGSILAIALNPVMDQLRWERRWCLRTAWLSAFILLGSIAVRDVFFRETFRYSIQGLALFPIFIYVIRYNNSRLTRILEWRPLAHLGELSYSLYLIHEIV
jgi:peptidoglycan/LPS O-acetylase OafA/YrhL